MRIALPVLFALMGCTACSMGPDEDAPPAVDVSITRIAPEAQLVTGAMRNMGGKTLTFGDCSAGLETGASGDWVRVPREGACDMWAGSLHAGKTVEFSVPLPADLPDCPLRLSVGLGVDKVLDLTVTGHSSEFCPGS